MAASLAAVSRTAPHIPCSLRRVTNRTRHSTADLYRLRTGGGLLRAGPALRRLRSWRAAGPSVVHPLANADHRGIQYFRIVGNGRATLTINDQIVPVQPNGAFLAWLPLPAPDQPRYALVASLGADTARVSHAVRLLPPRPVFSLAGPLVVDSNSVAPRGTLSLRDDEPVRVSVRAPSTPRCGFMAIPAPGVRWSAEPPSQVRRWSRGLTVSHAIPWARRTVGHRCSGPAAAWASEIVAIREADSDRRWRRPRP
jgi:hypothetical protein